MAMLASIDIDRIEVRARLRDIDKSQVEALCESFRDVGMMNPITLFEDQVIRGGIAVDGYGLVAGAHRLEAAKQLGWAEIDAKIVSLSDLERQIAECDENLVSPKLTPSERAWFTRRRKDAYEALHPETRHGGDHRPSGQLGHLPESDRFTLATAKATGRSERDIRRDFTRADRIDRDVIESIKRTDLDTGVVLDALASVPKPEQRAKLQQLQERSVKPAPAIKNAFESEEDWRRSLFTVWNRGAQDWRERAMAEMDPAVFDRTSAA